MSTARTQPRSSSAHRGVVLPVVLVLIGLLALIMAGFMFHVRAELAGIEAQRDGQQARLAAESGLEEVVTVLRASPDDPTAWMDVPERFRHALIWSEAYVREEDPAKKMGSRKDILLEATPKPAWRYSVVAQNFDGPPNTLRYGVTPEASKLNLNAASDTEIERLLQDVLPALQIQNVPELVAALLDWRDPNASARPGGAKTDYYTNLTPGYKAKNGRFDTVEELLLVKGFSAAVLYGEDTNRNGLLDQNEDDGPDSFPYYDNGDGQLQQGIAPFLTVWSREPRAPSQQQGPPQGGQPQEQGQPQGEGENPEGGEPAQPGTEGEDTAKSPPKQSKDGQPTSQPGGSDAGALAGLLGGGTGKGQVMKEGLIDVNTAPLRVLRVLDGMPAEAAEAIVTMRQQLPGDVLKTADWVVTQGAVDATTYAAIKDKITTRALQFHVEIVGYADHTKVARRYEWIIDMRGTLAQVVYHRDLTKLGLAWPVDDDKFMVAGR